MASYIDLWAIYLLIDRYIILAKLPMKMFEDQRRGWDEERKEWAENARKHREELEQWATERRQHEDEKIQWAGERAHEMSRMWDYPNGEECRVYDLREYSVRLDIPAVCKMVPITVEDRIVMAETCEVEYVRHRFRFSPLPNVSHWLSCNRVRSSAATKPLGVLSANSSGMRYAIRWVYGPNHILMY